MFKRNHDKLFSLSLIAAVLAGGLTAQGAFAMVDPKHEHEDPAREAASETVVEREGPQGEVLLRRAEDTGSSQRTARVDRAGITGNLPN